MGEDAAAQASARSSAVPAAVPPALPVPGRDGLGSAARGPARASQNHRIV